MVCENQFFFNFTWKKSVKITVFRDLRHIVVIKTFKNTKVDSRRSEDDTKVLYKKIEVKGEIRMESVCDWRKT